MRLRSGSWFVCLAFACSGGDPAGEPSASSNELDNDDVSSDDDASTDDDSNNVPSMEPDAVANPMTSDPSSPAEPAGPNEPAEPDEPTAPLDEPDTVEGCRAPVDVATLLLEPTTSMPSTLSGTLCGTDALWLVVDGTGDDSGFARIRANLQEGQGPYTLALFEVVDGELAPMRTEREANVLTLDESTPEWVFAHRFKVDDARVVMQLEGPAGDVDVDIEVVELAPYLDCEPQYETVRADLTTVPLPASYETELCSGRDSRALAFDVEAGRPVTVTLENPYAIEAARISVLELASPREALPLLDGTADATLGLLAYPSFTFTPLESGPVGLGLYPGLLSRGEPMRISVTQE